MNTKYVLEPYQQTGLVVSYYYRDAAKRDLIIAVPSFCGTTEAAKARIKELETGTK